MRESRKIWEGARLGRLILLTLLCMSVMGLSASAGQVVKAKGRYQYKMAADMLSMINKARAKQKASKLALDNDLTEAAMQRALECSLYFSHTRPNGTMCYTVLDDMYLFGGENIAAGQRTTAQAFKSWMNSPGHKANILTKDFQSIGIGCAKRNGRYYWVQIFSREKSNGYKRPKDRNVTVTVKEQKDGSVTISVSKLKPKKMTNIPSKTTLTEGETLVLKPKFSPIGSGGKVTYTTSNKKVAKVSSSGQITAVKKGTAKITVKVGSLKKTCKVTVKEKPASDDSSSGSGGLSLLELYYYLNSM